MELEILLDTGCFGHFALGGNFFSLTLSVAHLVVLDGVLAEESDRATLPLVQVQLGEEVAETLQPKQVLHVDFGVELLECHAHFSEELLAFVKR